MEFDRSDQLTEGKGREFEHRLAANGTLLSNGGCYVLFDLHAVMHHSIFDACCLVRVISL